MLDTKAGGGSGWAAGAFLTLGNGFASGTTGLAGAREIAGPREGTTGGTTGAAGFATGTFREGPGTRGAFALAGSGDATDFDRGVGAGVGSGGDDGTTADAFVGRGRAATGFAGSTFFSAGLALGIGAFVDAFAGCTGTFWEDDDTGAFGSGAALATPEVVVAFTFTVVRSGFAGVAGEAGDAAGTGGAWGFGVAGVARRTGFIVFE